MADQELNTLAEKVAKILAASSQGVSEIPIVEAMDGINSLPCLRKVGDTEEVVEVPIPILAAPSIEAAKLATDAATNADKKATLANNAAALATEKATLADAAAKSADESKQAALDAAGEATAATKDASEATVRLNNLSDHRDEIRDGYWWHWNEDTGEYENTGELAKGNTLFASFDIDPTTGELSCTTDEEYTGASFSLENGDLVVTI